jgi:MFS family permease
MPMLDTTATVEVTNDARARGNVLRLAAAQALTGANSAVIFATGSIVGATLAPSISLATVPLSMYVLGLAAGTLPTGAISRAYGRRTAFIIGTFCGVLTGALAAIAVLYASFWLFCGATFLGGLYGAVAQSYRFAAADGASTAFRPKAVSWVMAGGVFAGVLGPQLVQWTMDIWPPYLFAFSFVVQAFVALVAMAVLWGVDAPKPAPSDMHGGRPLFEIARQPRFIAAALCGVIAYPMMNLVMTSAPLAMKMCGLTVSDSNFGIQWHIVAMYGPSFFTGSLIARFGAPRIVALGLLLEAAASGIGLSGITAMHFWATLIVLGVGWNFALYRRLRAGAGNASAAGTQQGAGVQRFPGVRDDGAGIVLVRPVAGALRLVDGKHGGVPAGAARPCGAVVASFAKRRAKLQRSTRFPVRVSDLQFQLLEAPCRRVPVSMSSLLPSSLGDHAGAIERFYTEDASMQENAAAPRVGRDVLVAHERAVLERVKSVTSTCVASGGRGRSRRHQLGVRVCVQVRARPGRFDEVALQEWRGDRVFRERFFYDPSKPAA